MSGVGWLRTPPGKGGMDLERAELKVLLVETLAEMTVWQGSVRILARCQLCGNAFIPGSAAPDLHELLVERDDVQGAPETVIYEVMHTTLNLTLLCNPCNLKPAKDNLLRHYLIFRQACRYGAEPLFAWVSSLPLASVGTYAARIRAAASQFNRRPDKRPAANVPPYDPLAFCRPLMLTQVRKRLNSYGQLALF